MRSLGCLVLMSLWTSTILADTGVYFPQNNVRLRRSPDKLGGGGRLDSLRHSIPGEPGRDYPIHGQSILCKLNPAQFGGSCGGGGGRRGAARRRGKEKLDQAAAGAGTGYGAPAEDAAEDYNDYEETATDDDYSYDEEAETAAASQPGGGYLAPAEEEAAAADASEYDYGEEPADDYDYNEAPAEEEPADYEYNEAPAEEEPADYEYNEEPADYDYNVAPEAQEPGGGYLAPEETAEESSPDYEYDEYSAAEEEAEAAPEDLDTGYLAPAQSEGRRARNNRPASRKIAQELVSSARQLVRDGPNANDLKRLKARQGNNNSVGRRSRNNRPSSQQRRQKPKQNSIQRRGQKEISARGQQRREQKKISTRGQQQQGKNKIGQSSRKSGRKNTNQKAKPSKRVGTPLQCPGGSLDNCIDVCPGSSAKVYVACVTGCSSRCEPKANPRRRTN